MALLNEFTVNNGNELVPVEVVADVTKVKEYIKLKCGNSKRENKEDPFVVIDLGRLLYVHRKWTAALPSVWPFYAVKCNDDRMLLKTLAALGTGFDCASKNEIKRVLDLGVSPDRIVYANPCKQISYLEFAAEAGVELMTFDDELELHKVKKYFPTAKLVVRIRADCANLTVHLGVKYGCAVSSAKHLVQVAASMGLTVVGVSFHVGSNCVTPASYLRAMEMASEVFHYAADNGQHLTLLDIGGGFPGHKTKEGLFSEMAATINQGLDLFSRFPNLKVIAEPGRYFASSTHAVAVNVIGKKILPPSEPSASQSFMYYVSDGTYGSFNGVFHGHPILIPELLEESSSSKQYKASLWGPTCDGIDKICEYMMPEVQVEDWLYFDNMGDYSVCAVTTFNGFPRPYLYYYVKESESETLSALLDVGQEMQGRSQ